MQLKRVEMRARQMGIPTAITAPNTPRAHSVQFYEDESFFYGTVAEFIARGLANGQPALVVAAESRRQDAVAPTGSGPVERV